MRTTINGTTIIELTDDDIRYRQSLSTPQILANVRNDCDLLKKAISGEVARLTAEERREFEAARAAGHPHFDATAGPTFVIADICHHLDVWLERLVDETTDASEPTN